MQHVSRHLLLGQRCISKLLILLHFYSHLPITDKCAHAPHNQTPTNHFVTFLTVRCRDVVWFKWHPRHLNWIMEYVQAKTFIKLLSRLRLQRGKIQLLNESKLHYMN